MKSRLIVFVVGLILFSSALVSRLVYLHVFPNENLDRLAKNQFMTIVQIPPERGKILDRKGEELATNKTTLSLYTDTTLVEAPRRLSKKLARELGLKERDLYKTLTSGKKFAWIQRHLSVDRAGEIKSWKESALRFIEESQRVYPNQSLLSQTLGIVGTDGEGLEGLEKKYDVELKGEKQSIPSRRDARGRPLVVSGQLFEYQGDGATIETTIDKDLQYELEQELARVSAQQSADAAMGIIMDPATGEILALGSYPTFDPQGFGQSKPEARKNRVVTDVFEPGSTFKAVTVAAAIRSGKIQPNTKFFCENGQFKVGGHIIHEAESTHGFGWLTLSEILAVSSNIGTSKVALTVGQEAFRQMIGEFGFGEKTGIDFPGEAQGLLTSGKWPDHLLSAVSFGHGVGVTSVQMASIYSAIANGGTLMRPYLVKSIRDPDGKLIERRTPEIKRRVLSSKEASLMTLMLSGVTEVGGTGTLARVDGYPVAGKTGTAQKVDPHRKGYLSKSYLASFIGFVPANNPQFTIFIVVDNPKKQFYGAQVAAPSFNRLASFALHQRGFMPIVVSQAPEPLLEGPSWAKKEVQNLRAQDVVPDLHGLTLREVTTTLQRLAGQRQMQTDLVGEGLARDQWPLPGQPWAKKLRVVFEPKE